MLALHSWNFSPHLLHFSHLMGEKNYRNCILFSCLIWNHRQLQHTLLIMYVQLEDVLCSCSSCSTTSSPSSSLNMQYQHGVVAIKSFTIYQQHHIVQGLGIWPKNIFPKPAWYFLSDSLEVLVRHSQAQNCFQINL